MLLLSFLFSSDRNNIQHLILLHQKIGMISLSWGVTLNSAWRRHDQPVVKSRELVQNLKPSLRAFHRARHTFTSCAKHRIRRIQMLHEGNGEMKGALHRFSHEPSLFLLSCIHEGVFSSNVINDINKVGWTSGSDFLLFSPSLFGIHFWDCL
jgi:hypothetical protein